MMLLNLVEENRRAVLVVMLVERESDAEAPPHTAVAASLEVQRALGAVVETLT